MTIFDDFSKRSKRGQMKSNNKINVIFVFSVYVLPILKKFLCSAFYSIENRVKIIFSRDLVPVLSTVTGIKCEISENRIRSNELSMKKMFKKFYPVKNYTLSGFLFTVEYLYM